MLFRSLLKVVANIALTHGATLDEGLRESVDRFNGTNDEFSIRFAFGGVLSSEVKDASIYSLINMAEQRMYRDKAAAKQAESLDP